MTRLLLLFILMEILIVMNYPVFSKPLNKMDVELQMVLEKSNPSELISIIVVFHDEPTEDQINILKTVHKMNVTYVYRIIDGIAGKAPAEETPKIAEYDWVKEIWLDRKVYPMSDKTVKISELIEMFQKENDELRETISTLNQNLSKLQEQINVQQNQIAQLDISLKMYSTTAFIAGLIAGIATAILITKARK